MTLIAYRWLQLIKCPIVFEVLLFWDSNLTFGSRDVALSKAYQAENVDPHSSSLSCILNYLPPHPPTLSKGPLNCNYSKPVVPQLLKGEILRQHRIVKEQDGHFSNFPTLRSFDLIWKIEMSALSNLIIITMANIVMVLMIMIVTMMKIVVTLIIDIIISYYFIIITESL